MKFRILMASSLLAIALFVAVDFLAARAMDDRELLAGAVDIETPQTYLAKLDFVRRQSGGTVAVIGDSQVVGQTMAEHGDADWRDHTIDRQLQRKLRARSELEDAIVVNFGANGLLPADMELIVRDVRLAGADVIVFNAGLRSLSGDFNTSDARFARPWLASLCRDEHALPRLCSASGRTTFPGLLGQHWTLYRTLEFLQERYLGAPLNDLIVDLAERVHASWREEDEDSLVSDELLLMLRARTRFDTVTFDEGSLQVGALRRSLVETEQAGSRLVGFYTTENALLFNQIMNPARAAEVRTQLLDFLNDHASDNIRILPPVEELGPRHFLDFMHLDADGYRILVDHLEPLVAALLATADTAPNEPS